MGIEREEADGTIITVAGWPEDEKSERFKTKSEISSSVSIFLESIIKNAKLATIDVIFITNPTGGRELATIWRQLIEKEEAKKTTASDGEGGRGEGEVVAKSYSSNVHVYVRIIDIMQILGKTAEKHKVGLRVPLVFRLWQLPKLWVGELLPDIRRAILVDLDVVVNVNLGALFDMWRETLYHLKLSCWDMMPHPIVCFILLKQNSDNDNSLKKHCYAFGAVPEIGNTIKDHEDFRDVPDRYINSGVLLIDFTVTKRLQFYNKIMDFGIYKRSEPRRPTPQGQWPPEQWVFNAIFAHIPSLMYPMHRKRIARQLHHHSDSGI
eukprot:jgi/Bigna1/79729/fgenesh1_pg.65_\